MSKNNPTKTNNKRSSIIEHVTERWQRAIWVGFVGFWLLYILLPPIMLLTISFDSKGYVRVPQDFSLFKYELMFRTEGIIDAIQRSLVLAVLTTILTTLLAMLAVMSYRKTKYKRLLLGGVILPLFIPGAVHGFGLMIYFTNTLTFINSKLLQQLIGHVLWAFPFAFLVLLTSFSAVKPEIISAASDLGASEYETFKFITYPLVKPGIISAAIFSFVLSINEFSRTVFLYERKNTITTYVWAKIQTEISPELFAIAGIIVIVSLTLIVLGTLYLYRSVE